MRAINRIKHQYQRIERKKGEGELTSADQMKTPLSQLSSEPTESKIVMSLAVMTTRRCSIVTIMQVFRERIVGTTVGTA